MNVRRTVLPALATTAALAGVTVSAVPAGAHVTVTPDTTAAGSYAVLTFSVGHGCEGSPTTGLAIALPEEIPTVTPTVKAGWSVEKVTEKLAEPVTDSHGNEITERVARVVYTAETPLADGYRDTVELSVMLPDAAGETLAFPVVQSCVEGETGWVETAAEGAAVAELESPAPTLTLTETTGDGHGTATGTGQDTDQDTGQDTGQGAGQGAEADDDAALATGLAVGGLVAGLAGLALGALALARTRRA
ncbi:YcnI family protein [Nocardioides sp. zg-ZUI104]|uniref:YcnI family copper-binding membrane protein n=1 Tax=Nocardioides faecalis TaxID=2803858 RepID=UPI001BCD67B6|nr:YcnI family protein [Nocardioides faecalis]MBS4751528.1 YcnI family protein [Nocardioides faecalis]